MTFEVGRILYEMFSVIGLLFSIIIRPSLGLLGLILVNKYIFILPKTFNSLSLFSFSVFIILFASFSAEKNSVIFINES